MKPQAKKKKKRTVHPTVCVRYPCFDLDWPSHINVMDVIF